jgi:small subunit ribosomal protein S20
MAETGLELNSKQRPHCLPCVSSVSPVVNEFGHYQGVTQFDRPRLLPYNKEFGPTRISCCTHEGNEPDMANHLSALKRARQTVSRTARNRANTSTLRTQLRDLRETIEKGDKPAAEQAYRQTVSALDKAIQKGTLHENTASRYKSRLGVRVNAMK